MMTIQETAEIIKKIKFSYPTAFQNLDIKQVVNYWHEELQKCDFDKAMKVTSDFIRNSQYPPTIADIYESRRIDGYTNFNKLGDEKMAQLAERQKINVENEGQ